MEYVRRCYLRLYLDIWQPLVNKLDEERLGELVYAMVNYATGGAIPEFDDEALQAVWPYVKAAVDRDLKTHEIKERRAAARRAARKRGNGPAHESE